MIYVSAVVVYDGFMRTVIDVDDEALEAARVELGTETKRDTVNAALRFVAQRRSRAARVNSATYLFGGSDIDDADIMGEARR